MKRLIFYKGLLLLILLCLFATLSNACLAQIDPGSFVGAWTFDEGSGESVSELSGKSSRGRLSGNPQWVDGKFDKALSFDGKDDYVEIQLPDIFNKMAENSFTIAFWTNVRDISGSNEIWTRLMEARNDDRNYIQFVIQMNDGELGVNIIVDGTETTFIVDTPIKSDTWYHVTATWDAKLKSLKLYLNGVLQSKVGTVPASPGTQKILNIGRRSDGNEKTYFEGIIDELVILNIVITEKEIESLMSQGIKKFLSVSVAGKHAITWGDVKKHGLMSEIPHRLLMFRHLN